MNTTELPSSPVGRIVRPLVPLAIISIGVAFALLSAATLWAASKSRERAACYRAALRIDDCPQPGAFESLIRRLNEVQKKPHNTRIQRPGTGPTERKDEWHGEDSGSN